jgi:hypothetical protein
VWDRRIQHFYVLAMLAKVISIAMLCIAGSDTIGDCADSSVTCESARDDNALLQRKVKVSRAEADTDCKFDKLEDVIAEVEGCFESTFGVVTDAALKDELDVVARAEIIEITEKCGLVPDNVDVLRQEAVREGGLRNAKFIVNRNLETIAKLAELYSTNLTRKEIDNFAGEVGKVAGMCGMNKSEVKEKVTDDILTVKSRLAKGPPSKDDPPSLVPDIVEDVEESCMAHLDLLKYMESGPGKHCSKILDQALTQLRLGQVSQRGLTLNKMLALSTEENDIASRMAQHIRHGTDPSSLKPKIDRLFDGPLTESQKQRLSLMETEQERLHTSETCASYEELLARDPNHWISQHNGYQLFMQCLCNAADPAIICEHKHKDTLQEMNTELRSRLLQIRGSPESLEEALAKDFHEYLGNATAVLFGPCDTPFACEVCAGSVCAQAQKKPAHRRRTSGASKDDDKDNFYKFKNLLTNSNSCLNGECTACWGIKPNDPFTLEVTLAAGHGSDCKYSCAKHTMTKFEISLTPKVCLGGTMREVMDVLGINACKELGQLKYKPFVGVMSGWLRFPTPLKTVQSHIDFNAPIHDASPALQKHCDSLGTGNLQYWEGVPKNKPFHIEISGLCMDHWNHHRSDVVMWNCNYNDHQKWVWKNDGTISPSSNTNLCIDSWGVNNGDPLVLWNCNGNEWQTFELSSGGGYIKIYNKRHSYAYFYGPHQHKAKVTYYHWHGNWQQKFAFKNTETKDSCNMDVNNERGPWKFSIGVQLWVVGWGNQCHNTIFGRACFDFFKEEWLDIIRVDNHGRVSSFLTDLW